MMGRAALIVIAGIILALFLVWAALALYFDGARWALAVFVLIAAVCFAVAGSAPRRLVVGYALCAAVLFWWRAIEPGNDREWQADVARLPSAILDGSSLRISNMRNFRYSEDGATEAWVEGEYDLDEIVGVDVFLSHWGSDKIAHTITSWEFADGRHLAISIETRKEVGEGYSAVRGFFRQFEIYYVVSFEEDLVRLRTDQRKEDVYLYRLNYTQEVARALLLALPAEQCA